ncbi:MAG: DNA methyltransferase [Phycisphaeraceae bacterium]
MDVRRRPGEIRDAIVDYLRQSPTDACVSEIVEAVASRIDGGVAASSVRSYLRLSTPEMFERVSWGRYRLRNDDVRPVQAEVEFQPAFESGGLQLFEADCINWLRSREAKSIHAVVTDPPYGLVEYTPTEQGKLRCGKGGVWRIPPSYDGCKRSPLPRFTTLQPSDLNNLTQFFTEWAKALYPALVPGANVVIASNPLLSHLVSAALANAGFEKRGAIIRLVMTMRGGDRPKNAHDTFPEVSVMPRSMWEPWLVYRRPIEGRVQDNLRKWKTGGFRRPAPDKPFGDVIRSAPTHPHERKIAPHPSLKPQAFLRQVARAVLPLGEGVVLDPFAGSGSTLAACEAVGYRSIGIESDPHYVHVAKDAILKLRDLKTSPATHNR